MSEGSFVRATDSSSDSTCTVQYSTVTRQAVLALRVYLYCLVLYSQAWDSVGFLRTATQEGIQNFPHRHCTGAHSAKGPPFVTALDEHLDSTQETERSSEGSHLFVPISFFVFRSDTVKPFRLFLDVGVTIPNSAHQIRIL